MNFETSEIVLNAILADKDRLAAQLARENAGRRAQVVVRRQSSSRPLAWFGRQAPWSTTN